MRSIPLVLVTVLTGAAAAQDLRKAVADADLVAVARQVGRQEATPEVTLHRLQIVRHLRGGSADVKTVTVLDWPGLSLHHRPTPRQSRLYCLQDQSQVAARLGLDPAGGPYYRMVGWAGSNPLVGGDLDADPIVRFCAVLAAADAGAEPHRTADALFGFALSDAAVVRVEALRLLAERPDLRTRLSGVQWSALLSRVTGETRDIDYKTALAELCAEERLGGVVEALILGLGQVQDPDYARTVGRLTAHVMGEQVVRPFVERMPFAGGAEGRAALLLALGATRTEAALEVLLQWQREAGTDAAITAALREHRSPRALEAATSKSGK